MAALAITVAFSLAAVGLGVVVPDILNTDVTVAETTSGAAMDGLKLQPVAANRTTFDWYEPSHYGYSRCSRI